jgi:hypothetical protein
MEQAFDRVLSLPTGAGSAEERKLRGDLVREIVARRQRGEGIKRIARELGVDRKTVQALAARQLQPRRSRRSSRPVDRSKPFTRSRLRGSCRKPPL